jgi:adenylate cyclase
VSFFEDLKRRNVIRVAAAYAIVGWLVIQVAETVLPLFGFDDGHVRIVVILVAIGFPFALFFSWVYEFTPDGLKLERDIDSSRTGTQHSSKKLDRTIIVVLTLALGYFVIEKFIFDTPFGPDLDRSVAVLPFADMSPNGDQAYFGNGMAEQLRDELSRLDGLSVAPRALSTREPNESLRAVAEKLNVETVVEGSIRKDGDQVSITAQLINIADEKILWSEIYNRKLENIFDIQIEIATEVSGALGVKLGVGGVNAFRGAGTRNFEAYELYLRNPRTFNSDEAIRYLSRAIELDPNYAAALSTLALGLIFRRLFKYPGESREDDDRAFALILRAVEVEPESAQSNTILGIALQIQNDWIRAEEAHLKGVLLRSNQQDLSQYGSFLIRTGHPAVALEQYEKAVALEPSLTGLQIFHFDVAMPQGRFADARVAWALRPNHLPNRGGDLTIALHVGDSKEIKAIMAAKDPTEISTIELYAPVLKVFDSREMVLSTLRAAYADSDSRWSSKLTDIGLLAAYFGDEELALQTIGEETRLGSPRFGVVWYPLMADARQLQGFKELVTEMNLVEYWREKGWPDRCRAVGNDDFECW